MSITTLDTSTVFVKQHEHPEGFVPASSTMQCFTMTPTLDPLTYIYNVGQDVVNATSLYTIKKVTKNSPLSVEMTCPEYVSITPSKDFILPPNQSLVLTVEMD